MVTACPLCRSHLLKNLQHSSWRQRQFWHCQSCDLIFVDPDSHLSAEEELNRYQSHKNSPGDQGYVKYLRQLTEQLLKVLPKHGQPLRALDFGCGPGPALQAILKVENIQVHNYDPYFYPDTSVFNHTWSLILCSEVVEHFRRPEIDLQKMVQLLQPGGVLALMTQFHSGAEQFSNWWYAKDPTHLAFYSEPCWRRWQQEENLRSLYLANPVAIFQKDGFSPSFL